MASAGMRSIESDEELLIESSKKVDVKNISIVSHSNNSGVLYDENGSPLNNELEFALINNCNDIEPVYLEKYDDNISGITWYKAMFLIVNAALGAGLLNFPKAFNDSGGLVAGNAIHLVFVILALGSLFILGICASDKGASTYQEVVSQICSPFWSIVASICITLYCFVTCITFIIIIGDQFDRVFASLIGSDFCHTWYMNRQFTMVVCSIFLIFPSCFKRIDGLRFISFLGVLSIWYLTSIIIVEFYRGSYSRGSIHIWDVHWSQMFEVVPTICFGYQCHVSSIPIFSCLNKKNSLTFMKACTSAVFICLLVYSFSANYGYLTFGSYVEGDVLLSYDARKLYVVMAVIFLAIKSWTTYPILLFCVREAVSDMYLSFCGLTVAEATVSESLRRKAIAFILCILTIIMALFTPNINIVVQLLGSLAAIFIFIFPGLCLLNWTLHRNDQQKLMALLTVILLIVSVAYITLGLFTFGLALSLGVQKILNPEYDIPLCT